MASGNLQFSDAYWFHSFSVLNGVKVKVSDKFKPPVKVTLPIGWCPSDPSDLLAFQYDFSLEEEVIRVADEESRRLEDERKRSEERMLEEEEIRLQLEAVQQPRQQTQQTVTDAGESVQASSGQRLESLKDDGAANSVDAASKAGPSAGNLNVRPVDILTPTVLTNTSPDSVKNQLALKGEINFREFEDQNENPFELAELSAIDDLDELRSVLEPGAIATAKTSRLTDAQAGSCSFELDSRMRNPVVLKSDARAASRSADANAVVSMMSGAAATVITSSSWVTFEQDSRLLESLVAKSSTAPSEFHATANVLQNLTRTATTTAQIIPRAKSLPDLVKEDSMSRSSDAGNPPSVLFRANADCVSIQPLASARLLDTQHVSPRVPADRLSNIMKQFPFQRIAASDVSGRVAGADVASVAAATEGTVSHAGALKFSSGLGTDQYSGLHVPTYPVPQLPFPSPMGVSGPDASWESHYRHTALPPGPGAHQIAYGPPSFSQPPLPKYPGVGLNHTTSVSDQPRLPAPASGVQVGSKALDLKMPPRLRLPLPATSSFPSSYVTSSTAYVAAVEERSPSPASLAARRPMPTNSWLDDVTSFLSTVDKNFALQLANMGFPLASCSRAVKRLGRDEKEIVEFLCQVQEYADKGHPADDVEAALIYTESNQEKTLEYLKLVSAFRELGFEAKQIHRCLQESNLDTDKALDSLTR